VTPEPISASAPPLPGPGIIRQRWRDAVFLHWRVDAAAVTPLLPPGTRPDEHDGGTWVGLIPFRLEASQLFSAPPVPWLGTFLETNVRLYAVDEQGRRGVVFRTLEAQHLLPVLTAQVALGLPYRWARMRSRRMGDELGYASERMIGASRPRTRIRVRVLDEPVSADPLADFLTARWAMHVGRGSRTFYWRNEHEPWPLVRAELLELQDELLADSAFPGLAERPPDSVLFSTGVTTAFSAP
jgi:uncharacterized protein YqjF (DUF2071 family)